METERVQLLLHAVYQMIQLDASLSSNFDWKLPKKADYWYLDFGWDKEPLDPFHLASFNSFRLGMEEFCQRASENSRLILLKVTEKGFSPLLKWTPLVEERMEEMGIKNKELFSAHILSEYLHRLAAPLPDPMEPYVQVDISRMSAKLTLLLCKRRFEYFHLLFTNKELPLISPQAQVGVALPEDDKFDVNRFEEFFARLETNGVAFRAIPEELLNEHWEGIDLLYIDAEKIGERGRRMLCGFEAAGGEVKNISE